MFSLQHILFDMKTDHVGLITLNRPHAANALSIEMLKELQAVIDVIESNPTIRVVVLTGSGEKAFCAGADLKERKAMNEFEVLQTVKLIGETANKLENLSVPVIAGINGVAFGGGLEFSLACDIRIAANHAKVGLTETSLAIIPGAGGTQRLPRLIGVGKAKRLIYTASRLNAKEAYELGIVEEIVANEDLLTTAVDLASKIAENGPIAIKQAKKSINKGLEVDLQTGLEIEHLSYQHTIHTKDRLEGLQAFSEKRKPLYKGE